MSDGKDAAIIDAHLIGRGLLAPSKQGSRLKPGENVFQNALAELFVDEKGPDPVGAAEQLANDLVDQAAAEPPKKATKGRAGGKKKKT